MLTPLHKKRRIVAIGILAGLFSLIMGSLYAYPAIRTWASEQKAPPVAQIPADPDPVLPEPAPEPVPYVHPKVKGIYVSAYIASTPSRMNELLTWVEETELNGMVIDVKDDRGKIPWRTEVALAKNYNSYDTRLKDIENLIVRMDEGGIYPIARLVAFKDPALAEARPDLAVKSSAGGIWRDRTGAGWLDPHNWINWQYMVDVAKEAAAKGFKEIQFDYVRFPSDGSLSLIRYDHATGQPRAEVIRDFLAFAKSELEPLGIRVSADVFGLVTVSKTNDMGIGQILEHVYSSVDVVSPMLYPEHYAAGTFGIPDPDKEPYLTVLKSLQAAAARLEEHPNRENIYMRPWLQDFSLRHRYGATEIQAQIQAVYDAGFEEWLLWDPRCSYTREAFPKKQN